MRKRAGGPKRIPTFAARVWSRSKIRPLRRARALADACSRRFRTRGLRLLKVSGQMPHGGLVSAWYKDSDGLSPNPRLDCRRRRPWTNRCTKISIDRSPATQRLPQKTKRQHSSSKHSLHYTDIPFAALSRLLALYESERSSDAEIIEAPDELQALETFPQSSRDGSLPGQSRGSIVPRSARLRPSEQVPPSKNFIDDFGLFKSQDTRIPTLARLR